MVIPPLLNADRFESGFSYWLMHFDANPRAMHALGKQLRKEPLVLRWTMTKLSEKVEDPASKGALTMSFMKTDMPDPLGSPKTHRP